MDAFKTLEQSLKTQGYEPIDSDLDPATGNFMYIYENRSNSRRFRITVEEE